MPTNKSGKISGAVAATLAALALGACSKAPETAATAPAATAIACDRQCLIAATDSYIAALVAHDATKAPLAANAVFVENVTRMTPGEGGLWKTIVKGPDTFAVHVPDEVNQSAGYIGMITYMGPPQAPQGASPEQRAELAKQPPVEQPAIIGVRLKFDANGKITEAEHLVAGVREAQMVNLQAPRAGIFTEIPVANRKSHEELIKIGLSYYDALDDNNGELMPFAPDCERHENGMITASGTPSTAPAIPGAAAQPAVARDCASS